MGKKVYVFDIDDTLAKEIDFLRSGYHAVSELVAKRFGLDAGEIFENLFNWYRAGENAFDLLNKTYGLENPIEDYLNVYCNHKPEIQLEQDVMDTLNALRGSGIEFGIITDGRKITQKNKVNALGLSDWFDERCIIINSNPQLFKPDSCGYDRLMLAMNVKTDISDLEFTYIADNPEKDFLWPNAHEWNTICLLDDGRNIHKQRFDLPEEYIPKDKINSFQELMGL